MQQLTEIASEKLILELEVEELKKAKETRQTLDSIAKKEKRIIHLTRLLKLKNASKIFKNLEIPLTKMSIHRTPPPTKQSELLGLNKTQENIYEVPKTLTADIDGAVGGTSVTDHNTTKIIDLNESSDKIVDEFGSDIREMGKNLMREFSLRSELKKRESLENSFLESPQKTSEKPSNSDYLFVSKPDSSNYNTMSQNNHVSQTHSNFLPLTMPEITRTSN